MANPVELIMPKMGESIAEATILKWLKKEGDPIEMDEAVLEIATDKVDSEVPSPVAGIMGKALFAEGEVVAVGKAIALISTEANGAAAEVPFVPSNNGKTNTPTAAPKAEVVVAETITIVQPTQNSNGEKSRFYSPLVLNIARNESIGMAELETLNGTGKDNRVTKNDILNYLANRTSPPAAAPTTAQKSAPIQSINAPEVSAIAGDEIIEMDRMRKLIADHMVMSKQVSPHVTSFVEADVTNLVNWRNKIKNTFEKREGEKITFTPIFIECVVKAIKDFPNINVSVSGSQIFKHKNINIGMAAALPTGNLIVPVIKNADQKNLLGITKEVNAMATKARNNQLKPDDIQGGTFTLTNVGTFGNIMGTPIINQPQAAILAVGEIKKKPVVLETPQGDVIAIRQMMYLSLSYDHRVVDGMLGGSFLRRIADYLEKWDPDRVV
ncbi:MAG: dihydrolipoamide acetyltransferase family protein [Bacteroidetes bacterium]|nr:dihydrolipoamide acetyltransferase family protein [Bacteroidota bacterium]